MDVHTWLDGRAQLSCVELTYVFEGICVFTKTVPDRCNDVGFPRENRAAIPKITTVNLHHIGRGALGVARRGFG
jgi:hypothetical protein